MPRNATARIIALAFFTLWLGILLAGADHPPPPGFGLLILLDFIAAILVYLRLPTYVAWSTTRKKNRLLRVLLEGLVTGLVLALILQLIPGGGEPSVAPSLGSRLIWFAVIGGVGAANTLLLYGGCTCFKTKFAATKRASR
ncbi:MAG: hypothetical protein ACKOZW_03785 [Cyanobium sp.]